MTTLRNNELLIGEPIGIAPERTRYPMSVVLLSGQIMFHSEVGHRISHRFVIDLSTVSCSNTILANYNHDDNEVIGIGENIRIENGELLCDGSIIPFRPKDKAEEIVYRAKLGTPFEASIEFVPEACDVEEIKAGDNAIVNDNSVEGPALIYRNVRIRAFAVCPLGCDSQTKTMVLNQTKKMTTKQTNATLAGETKPDKTDSTESADGSKYPDLDQLQEMFGAELGVRMFKEGVALEDAKKVYEFNEKYGIVPKPEENDSNSETQKTDSTEKADESNDKTAELKAEIAKLSTANVKLTNEFAKLSARLTAAAEKEPLTGSQKADEQNQKELSPKEQFLSNFAAKFK
jgi:hypothetical protein